MHIRAQSAYFPARRLLTGSQPPGTWIAELPVAVRLVPFNSVAVNPLLRDVGRGGRSEVETAWSPSFADGWQASLKCLIF